MKSHGSIARFLSTLLIAVFIAIPAPMFAQDGSVEPPASTEVVVTNQEQEPAGPGTSEGEVPVETGTGEGEAPVDSGTGEGEAPSDPGAGEGEAPSDPGTGEGAAPVDSGTGEGEAPAEPGTGEGEAPAEPGTGEGETPVDPNNEDGTSEEEPDGSETEEPESDTSDEPDFSIQAEQGDGDATYYCDFRNQPSQGSVGQWWAAEDVAPDCINLSIVNSPATCSLTANFASYVVLSNGTSVDALTWYETDANGNVLREGGLPYPSPVLNMGTTGPVGSAGGSFTVTFPEDYNGGTAYVLINFNSPEGDIAPGMEQIDLDHWRTTSAGIVYQINTDCELPDPNFYCDYSNLTGAGDVYSWLASAPDGANTDCIDVGAPVEACGSLNIPFESRITGFGSGYALLWAEGTSIPDDYSLWNSSWPIAFAEDYNSGSVDVIVFIGGPEDDYYHFANEDPYPYPYPNQARGDIAAGSLGGGVQYTIDTDCVDPLPEPEMPAPPVAEVCQQALSGRTITSGPSADVVERPKFGDGGEVNADGWGTTFRLYGATDEPLTNVVATFQNTQGFHFGGTYNTLTSPGNGALQGNGYTVAVDGIAVTVTETTVTVTVASMPANSSWSVNVPIVVDIQSGQLYMDSTMISDLADCATVELALPTIVESVCDDQYRPTPASVTAPEKSESVTYSDVTATTSGNNITFAFTATANRGFTLEGATLPDGYTLVDAVTATYSITLTLADCQVPPTVVSPDIPVLVPATCGVDDAGNVAEPTLEIPTTEGVTYSEVTVSPANSVKLSLTAIANGGYTFVGATLPEGWTLVSSSEAVYEIVADTLDCPTPEPTETPAPGTPDPTETQVPATPAATDEPKAEEKAPAVKGLPETGSGSNPASMIGLAAIAAGAIAGAGLYFTNRKR